MPMKISRNETNETRERERERERDSVYVRERERDCEGVCGVALRRVRLRHVTHNV